MGPFLFAAILAVGATHKAPKATTTTQVSRFEQLRIERQASFNMTCREAFAVLDQAPNDKGLGYAEVCVWLERTDTLGTREEIACDMVLGVCS